MISHTVRVFKLMYIVAGILISNEEICDTVDRIQIAPRVEMKPDPEQRSGGGGGGGGGGGIAGMATRPERRDSPKSKRRRKVSVTGLAGGMVRGVTSKVTSQVTSRMGAHCSWLYNMPLILGQWRRLALSFTVWTIPNWLLEYTSSYISRKFFINSDCDMIYK